MADEVEDAIEIIEGYDLLQSFVEQFGEHPDFFNIVQGINAFLREGK